jgi:hypothetical protein
MLMNYLTHDYNETQDFNVELQVLWQHIQK